MKSSLSLLSIALIAGLLVQAPANATDKAKPAGKVVATVNGVAIPQSSYDVIAARAKAQGVSESPELQNEIRGKLIQAELLSQAAKKKGLDRNPDVQAQLDMARQQILANAYISDFIQSHPVTDAAAKAEYDKLVAQLGKKEYKARHILVKEEKDAKDIIERLKKGEKFDDLAKLSTDAGTKDRGGDLGWASPAGYVEAFGKALTTLTTGTYTQTPVQTPFGFHVIQLDDVRDLKAPSFEEGKAQIVQRLQSQQAELHLRELAKAAKIN